MNQNKNVLSTYNQQYKQAWGLRNDKNNGNNGNSNLLPLDDSAYEIPLDNDELGELTNLFNGLKASQESYDRDLASVASASTELKPVINLESIVTTDPNKKEQNIIVLISNLWICMCKLPITVLSIITTPSGSNLNFLYKQFFLILNIIFSVLRALSQSNIGCCVLLLFMCVIYQTQWGYATIQFCLGVFLYLYTNFPANIGVDAFIEKLKMLALAWLALIMKGPFVTWGTSILSSISTSTQALTAAAQTATTAAQTATVASQAASMTAQTASMTAQTASTVAQNALESVQRISNNVPSQLITALNSPDGILAIKQALESSAIMGSLALAWKNQEIFYDEKLLPQLNKIGNVLTSTSNNIEDVKLITETMTNDVSNIKQIVIEDVNAINELMITIKNNKEISDIKLREILQLVNRNLQTTDLGRLINANGLTPDTIVGFLTATQQNLARMMGKQQLLLQNGEMGGTMKKRTRKKKITKKKKSVKKKKKTSINKKKSMKKSMNKKKTSINKKSKR